MKHETRPAVLIGNSNHVTDQLLELSPVAAAIAVAVGGLERVDEYEAQIGISELLSHLELDLKAIAERCGGAIAPMERLD